MTGMVGLAGLGAEPSAHGEPPPRWVGWVMWGALLVFVAIGLATRVRSAPVTAAVGAGVALGVGALLVRVRPSLVLLGTVAASAGVVLLGNGMSSNVGWFAVCVLGGWCVLVGGARVGAAYWIGAVVCFAVEALAVEPDPGWGAWVAGTTAMVVGVGLFRRERALVTQLRAAQAGLAQRAQAEERSRIARELHDVIAHSLTVSLLHISSARLAVDYDAAQAAGALAEAERLGRESLAELRATMGMLRHGDEGGEATAPMPGVERLPELVERFRRAGADVTLTVDGDTGRLPATTGLGLYRIAQEALTNAVKHAPGAAVAVTIAAAADTGVKLSIDSSGEPGAGSGLGLASMRERAASLGGTCTAGPGGRGWLVRATLPTEAARPTGVAT
jgi:signal transduction histidine kinase